MRARREVVRAGNRAWAKARSRERPRQAPHVSPWALCSTCGWINDDHNDAGDGERTCSACGSASLMQLTAAGVLDVLVSDESEQALAQAPVMTRWVGRVAAIVAVVTSTVAFGGLVLALAFGKGRGQSVFVVLALAVVGMFGIPGMLAAARGFTTH